MDTLEAMTPRLWALHAALARRHDALSRRASEEAGQDMVEYALLLSMISTAAIAFVVLVDPQLQSLFGFIVGSLHGAGG